MDDEQPRTAAGPGAPRPRPRPAAPVGPPPSPPTRPRPPSSDAPVDEPASGAPDAGAVPPHPTPGSAPEESSDAAERRRRARWRRARSETPPPLRQARHAAPIGRAAGDRVAPPAGLADALPAAAAEELAAVRADTGPDVEASDAEPSSVNGTNGTDGARGKRALGWLLTRAPEPPPATGDDHARDEVVPTADESPVDLAAAEDFAAPTAGPAPAERGPVDEPVTATPDQAPDAPSPEDEEPRARRLPRRRLLRSGQPAGAEDGPADDEPFTLPEPDPELAGQWGRSAEDLRPTRDWSSLRGAPPPILPPMPADDHGDDARPVETSEDQFSEDHVPADRTPEDHPTEDRTVEHEEPAVPPAPVADPAPSWEPPVPPVRSGWPERPRPAAAAPAVPTPVVAPHTPPSAPTPPTPPTPPTAPTAPSAPDGPPTAARPRPRPGGAGRAAIAGAATAAVAAPIGPAAPHDHAVPDLTKHAAPAIPPPPSGPPTAPAAAPGGRTRKAPRAKKGRAFPWRGVIRLLIVVGIAVLAAVLLRVYVVQPYYIPSASMEPTLHGCPGCNDDRILVDKLSYRSHGPNTRDIVVFDRPPGDNAVEPVLIKRVVGVGGDTVSLRAGLVYVNGLRIHEPYINPKCGPHPSNPLTGKTVWRVPEHDVFVMGDNRCNSHDSRAFGPIKDSAIIGRAFAIYWPISRVGTL